MQLGTPTATRNNMNGDTLQYSHTAEYGGITVGVLEDQHGHLWFFAQEIAQAYGARDAYNVTKYVRDKYKAKIDIRSINPLFDRVINENQTMFDRSAGNPNRSLISEYGLYEFMMRGNTARAEQFREWVVEELLPAIRRGEAISTDGTPMQDVQDMTGMAALVGRIEILERVNREQERINREQEGVIGTLVAEFKSIREDRDYWRTVAEGLSKTEVHIYGDPVMSDLINLK